jgi:hypothetical protein
VSLVRGRIVDKYPLRLTGVDPHALDVARYTDSAPPKRWGHNKGEVNMQIAVIYAFVVVAGAPLIGIWRAHVWAKSNGMVLRTVTTPEQNQTA